MLADQADLHASWPWSEGHDAAGCWGLEKKDRVAQLGGTAAPPCRGARGVIYPIIGPPGPIVVS